MTVNDERVTTDLARANAEFRAANEKDDIEWKISVEAPPPAVPGMSGKTVRIRGRHMWVNSKRVIMSVVWTCVIPELEDWRLPETGFPMDVVGGSGRGKRLHGGSNMHDPQPQPGDAPDRENIFVKDAGDPRWIDEPIWGIRPTFDWRRWREVVPDAFAYVGEWGRTDPNPDTILERSFNTWVIPFDGWANGDAAHHIHRDLPNAPTINGPTVTLEGKLKANREPVFIMIPLMKAWEIPPDALQGGSGKGKRARGDSAGGSDKRAKRGDDDNHWDRLPSDVQKHVRSFVDALTIDPVDPDWQEYVGRSFVPAVGTFVRLSPRVFINAGGHNEDPRADARAGGVQVLDGSLWDQVLDGDGTLTVVGHPRRGDEEEHAQQYAVAGGQWLVTGYDREGGTGEQTVLLQAVDNAPRIWKLTFPLWLMHRQ